ncbi:MAG: hypothetical protein HN919_14400 [Verrucomicrobia bacterium]|nr:hypothetical protein [Verrucomicrobiota bacterium]
MGDRCYLQLTLRRKDLDRFGAILNEPAGTKRWNEDVGEPAPGIVEIALHEANYALWDERELAAGDGIPFFGNHGAGGDYAGCEFVSLDGRQLEVYTDREGMMCVQIDDHMRLLTDIGLIRKYLEKQRSVQRLFGIPTEEEQQFGPDLDDQQVGQHYVLHVIGDVEPQLHGPYASAPDRDRVAIDLRKQGGDEDGLYRLDITAGLHPLVYPYSSYELEPKERYARHVGNRSGCRIAA